jgi:signal transduction histidine kinase
MPARQTTPYAGIVRLTHLWGSHIGRSPARPTVGDLVLGLFVTVAVGLTITADLASGAPGTRGPGLVAYGFALALGALMVPRRRWPLATLVASLVLLALYHRLSYPPVGVAVPTAAALYSAAERGHIRWAAASAAVFLAVTTAIRVRQGDERLDFLFGYELVTAVTLTTAVIALGDAVRSRRGWQAETLRREKQAEIEHELAAARRVAEERMAIAREVHDVIAHTVSVISIQADVAAEALEDDPAATRSALRAIREASGRALADLRATLHLLRGAHAPRRPLGGLTQLDRVVSTAADSGLKVTVDVRGEPSSVPGVVDSAAHRIVQESITNVLRHARATVARIELCYGEDALTLRVSDDGCGADGTEVGYGIAGMGERVALLGGSLRTGSRRGGGFEVEATLPLGGVG